MNETLAIELCLKHRDPRGFEYLVRQYRHEAYYHAFGFLGDAAEAEEICQESFSRAFSGLSKVKELPRFYPWFYRILKHGCLNRLRDRRVTEPFAERSAETYCAPYSEANSKLQASPQSEPATNLELESKSQRVWLVLDLLKPEFREVLILKHLHEYSYLEISSLIDIPRGTVMSRLYHARKTFQAIYEQLDQDESHD